ncbi:FkbM family methyltransferase [Candidatus Pelagibacter sp.]|nr:FkbM family methyltransferase [Candidatus Pelagibacter sp.]
MLTKITIIFIFLIKIFDTILNNLFGIDFYGFLNDKLTQRYCELKIKKKKIKFFIPNHITKWRVNTFFNKEPETLNWIDNFNKKRKIVFWDIGSNIGLYSIYAALLFDKIKIYSFEPSFLNLNILSRNIYINKLRKKINIFQLPLSNNKNSFQSMNETTLSSGGAHSTFGATFTKQKIINSYKILGTSLDNAIEKKLIEMPDYIKIDVDGIEYLILIGFSKFLSNKKTKSILIEINKGEVNKNKKIFNLLKKNKFKLKSIEQSKISREGDKKTYNYIYNKV